MIAKSELKHGAYYKGECRNASVARWNSDKQEFVNWRLKFGTEFTETICHPDDDEIYDVFTPFEEVSAQREIPL